MDWREQVRKYELENQLRNEAARKETNRIVKDLSAARIASEPKHREEGYSSGALIASFLAGLFRKTGLIL
jgi:hypothetical protein